MMRIYTAAHHAYGRLLSRVAKPYALLFNPYKNRRSSCDDLYDLLYRPEQVAYEQVYDYLERRGVRGRRLPINFWAALREGMEGQKRNPEVGKQLDAIHTHQFTPGEWLALSMYLLGFGYAQQSLVCRRQSYRALASTRAQLAYHFTYPRLYLSMQFDRGNWKVEDQVGGYRLTRRTSDIHVRRFILNERGIGKKMNPAFYDLVAGKRVAIVGPLDFDKDYRQEIDAFDLKVELNPLTTRRAHITEKYRGTPDIAYYNGKNGNDQLAVNYRDLYTDAKYIVFKEQQHVANLRGKVKARRFVPNYTLPYNGSFKMVENIVMDLNLFDVAEIKVFGTDMTLSTGYSKSYVRRTIDTNSLYRTHVGHDIFTQFNFMKKAQELGYVSGDDRLTRILNLSVQQYAAEIEENYPAPYYSEYVSDDQS